MRALAGAAILAAIACACAPEAVESRQAAVLNGADDRLDAYQVPQQVRGPLLGASAALIYAHHLVESAPDAVTLRAPPAGAALGLCADERFASQPAAAFCSGVLIDDDLVATAGHCLGSDAAAAARRCRDLRIAFSYAFSAADRPVELAADDVFACRRVVAVDSDVAVLQLDRPAAGALAPIPIAAASAVVGDELIVASHGAGLPLKIELGAAVVAGDSSELTVAMDTFTGSSGGGLFSQQMQLVGLIEDGDVDWEDVDGCARAAHSAAPREHAIPAGRVVAALCRTGWPSVRLCGKSPACGDAVCTPGEAHICPADCPVPHCGDLLCEPAERGACREDCARFASVPEGWLDDPAAYLVAAAPPSSSGCSVSSRGNQEHAAAPVWSLLALMMVAARRSRAAAGRSASRGTPSRPRCPEP